MLSVVSRLRGYGARLVCPVRAGAGAVIAGALPSSTKHADSIDLELEVDPLNVDHFSCTPLVSSVFAGPRTIFPGWRSDARCLSWSGLAAMGPSSQRLVTLVFRGPIEVAGKDSFVFCWQLRQRKICLKLIVRKRLCLLAL